MSFVALPTENRSSFSWWIQMSLGMVSVSSWVALGSIVSDCTVIG